jgi:ABC-type multidrug transport system permease subunit
MIASLIMMGIGFSIIGIAMLISNMPMIAVFCSIISTLFYGIAIGMIIILKRKSNETDNKAGNQDSSSC